MTRIWGGGSGPQTTDFNTATNWTGDVVPGVNDIAQFDATDATNCIVSANILIGRLLVNSSFGGSFDANDFNITLDDSGVENGNILLGTTSRMGSGTWDVDGNFDYGNIGIGNFFSEGSTLIMRGSSKSIIAYNNGSGSNSLLNTLNIIGTVTVIKGTGGNSSTSCGSLTVSGTLSGRNLNCSTLSVTSTGTISTDWLRVANASIVLMDGIINSPTLYFYRTDGGTSNIVAATYDSPTVTFHWPTAGSGIKNIHLGAGTFIFKGNVDTAPSGPGTKQLDCSINNPNIEFQKGFSLSTMSLLNYTKGTGIITMNNSIDGVLSGSDQDIENVVIAKTSGGKVTLGSDLLTDSLSITSGNFDGNAFNTDTVGNTSISTPGTVTGGSGKWTSNGNYIVSGSPTIDNSGNTDFDIYGNISISPTITYITGTGRHTLLGSINTTIDIGTDIGIFYSTKAAGFSATLISDLIIDQLVVTLGDFDSDIYNITVLTSTSLSSSNTGTVFMGSGTWDFSGPVTIVTTAISSQTSTVIFRGTPGFPSTPTSIRLLFLIDFYDVEIRVGHTRIDDTRSLRVLNNLIVDSIIDSRFITVTNGTLSVTSTGNIITYPFGPELITLDNSDIIQMDGIITRHSFIIKRSSVGTSIWAGSNTGGNYDVHFFILQTTGSGSKNFRFGAGTHKIRGQFSIDFPSSTTNIDSSTNNPDIECGLGFVFNTPGPSFSYTKGTGTLTLNGSSDDTLQTIGEEMEDIVIAQTSGGKISLASDLNCESLSVTLGNFDQNEYDITTDGDVTVGASGIWLVSSVASQINFNGTGAQKISDASGTVIDTINVIKTSGLFTVDTNISVNEFFGCMGDIDINGKSITTLGAFCVSAMADFVPVTGLNGSNFTVGGVLSFSGSSGNILDMKATTPFTIDALNPSTFATFVDVSNSDASAGFIIFANDGTSIDSGGNGNWNFGSLISGAGGKVPSAYLLKILKRENIL